MRMHAALLLLFFAVGAATAADRPNIILCMTDDQGWGDVGYNGLTKAKTPHLDAMAAAGLRLNRSYAAAPVCSPTRGSCLTGRHPNRYGTFLYGRPLRREETTIAQVLRKAGYATGHFGKWHLNGVSGAGKPIPGNDPLSPGAFGFDEWLSVSNYFDLDWTLSRQGVNEKFTGDGSDYIVAQALKFMDQAAQAKKPFLAVIWFGNPHTPHRALADDQTAANGSAYYGEIVAIDRAMGKLRADLRQAGLADNTLLWFTSDNGAAKPGSTGGLRGMKGSCWEGGIRVPGLIEWPARIKKPMQSDVPVVTSDIFPTILDIVAVRGGLQPLDGISIVPLIDGMMTERPRPIGFWHYGGPAAKFDADGGQAAWSDNRFKLIKLGTGKFELHDLIADRNETKDLAVAQPAVVEKMKAELAAWQQLVLRSYRGEDYPKP